MILRTTDLTVGHGGEPLLRGVDLVVAARDVLVLRGPNGSGKSTLLRTLAGLTPPVSGAVDRGPGRLGWVPQHMPRRSGVPATVAEVVATGTLPARGRRARRDAVRDVVERLGLTEKLHEPVHRLSGGQQRRVLLARALVGAPTLLLLDEPTAGVDAASTTALLATLRQHRDGGGAVVLATHDDGVRRELATSHLDLGR